MLLKVLDCERKLRCPLLMHPSARLLQPSVAMGIWETASLMCELITLSQEKLVVEDVHTTVSFRHGALVHDEEGVWQPGLKHDRHPGNT